VDVGEDEAGPYVVLEHVPLPPLEHAIGRTDAAWIEGAARAAFASLAAVHEASDTRGPLGVVHADLSPANVLVDASSAVIVDFGLARWRDRPGSAGGAFAGTIGYAAPELARGETIDTRADLFALAASLLHALSGSPPRAQTTEAARLAAAGDDPIDAWAAAAARPLAPPLRDALVACVAFDRDRRPARAADVCGKPRA
jgi:serine/threonine-protein kinase